MEGHIRALGAKIGTAVEEADLESLIASWGSGGGLSEHTRLEIAAALRAGRQWGDGEPVPGCACARCTGLPEDHPARVPALHRKLQERRTAARRNRHEAPERRRAWEARKQRAMAVSITEIVHRLGLGPPEGRGREPRVLCPFHDDTHPSLRLSTAHNLWYCDPCGEGGDAVGLYRRVRGIGFKEAVEELTP